MKTNVTHNERLFDIKKSVYTRCDVFGRSYKNKGGRGAGIGI